MRATISLIAAMAENRVIGRGGSIPWHIPSDLRRFRDLTMGHPLIVGRKTFESIGKILPGREMIVLTRQDSYRPPGCLVAHTLREALQLAGGEGEIFIGGGGEVFREALPLADRVYLTIVHEVHEGDTLFPELPAEFVESAREEVQETPAFAFVEYVRCI